MVQKHLHCFVHLSCYILIRSLGALFSHFLDMFFCQIYTMPPIYQLGMECHSRSSQNTCISWMGGGPDPCLDFFEGFVHMH